MKSLHKGLARGALALYGVQFFRKIIPLISIPFLTRILGPAGWGIVAYVLAFSDLVVQFCEFGFSLSATREIARKRDDREHCSRIASGVVGAQLIMVSAGLLVAVPLSRFLPLLRDHPNMLLAGCLYAVVQGIAPYWLFQGLERMRLVAGLEILGKIAGLVGLLLFVHGPQDAWKVLAAYTVPPAVACAAGFWIAHRAIPLRWPTWEPIKEAFQAGWPLFVYKSGESLYVLANAFTLGFFATAEVVGYFAAAEKIARAAFGLLNPIRDVLYPRLSKLFHESPQDASTLAKQGVVVLCSGGVLLGLGLELFAAPLIQITGGSAFAPAAAILRILAVLPVVLSATYAVGMQTLLPQGRDKTVCKVILFAGILNIALAIVLAPRFAANGMAVAVVLSELTVMALLIRAVVKLDSFHANPIAPQLNPRIRTPLGAAALAAVAEDQA